MKKTLQVAVASGKGGTGKTTVSVGLAKALDMPLTYLDCDVEEPNGHIFLSPVTTANIDVEVNVPKVNPDLCVACGKCSKLCQFNAIITLGSKAMVFTEMCHSCGGCYAICPTGAISIKKSKVGSIKSGRSGNITVHEGILDIGHAMAPPVIRAVKEKVSPAGITIVDCPPGTSCPLLSAVKGADVVLLVTELTPFGLHDLKISVETMQALKLPVGVVINRSDSGDTHVAEYCRQNRIPLYLEIPEKRFIAEAYSRGISIVESDSELKEKFKQLLNKLMTENGVD